MIDQVRALGITMGTVYPRSYVGWTTDTEKATAAQELGATLRAYVSSDPTCTGWEVIVYREAEDSE